VPDLSFNKINAPVLPGFQDAENILQQVQKNRGYLESNFEAVMRARQEVEVYSMLEAVYNDRYFNFSIICVYFTVYSMFDI
jgi:hypothetical protein